MKAFAKTAMVKAVRTLPPRARKVLFDGLAKDTDSFQAAGEIARRLGLTGFVAEGDCGVIRGALDDDSVLAKYAKDGSWSPNERSLFKNLFAERGGTYLDIGANIGLTVIAVSQNTNVRCYAFEPEPNNFRHLVENVSVNCYAGNVDLLNVALFDKNAVVPFEIAVRHSGDHRISIPSGRGELGEHTRRKVAVQAKRLDDLVINGAEPLAAKIDVQGAEPFVIAGGQNVLSRARLLSLEFWPYSMRRMGGDINATIAFLVEHFQEGSISPGDKDREATWQPIVSVAALLQNFAKERIGKYDYLDVTVRKSRTG